MFSSLILASLLAVPQSGTLDQSSPYGNAWFNGGAASLTWQAEVATGVAGTLEGFELSLQGTAGATLDVRIRVGAGWNVTPPVWSGTLTTAGTGTWEIHYVDVSSAGIALSAGDLWVIEMNGATGVGLQGQYDAPPAQPPYPQPLYLNQPGCFADCGWRIGFRTWMLTGPPGPQLTIAGSCPGPTTLTFTGAMPGSTLAVLFGPAGTYVKSGAPCAGLTLGISRPNLFGFIPSNGAGAGGMSFNAPPRVCGLTVQLVDRATCLPSNAVVL